MFQPDRSKIPIVYMKNMRSCPHAYHFDGFLLDTSRACLQLTFTLLKSKIERLEKL